MSTGPDNVSPPPPRPVPPSRRLAILNLTAGLFTGLVGLSVALVGLGFANLTACGTGLGLAFAGLWMMLAYRGLSRRRPATYIGLGLAWVWLAARVVLDFPAAASAVVVFRFLIPAISLPFGLLWLVLLLAAGIGGTVRLVRMFRHRQLGPWSPKTMLATGGLLAVLVAITCATPELSWALRAKQIRELAEKYSAARPPRSEPVVFGACSMSFLGYSLTQHGAENTRDAAERQRIHDRVLGDAEAELASAKAAGARYLRVGASGDHLLTAKPGQEEMDDRS